MNARDPWRSVPDEYRDIRDALAVLEHALPAYRELVAAFREPLHRFLALDAVTASTGLAELAQSLAKHAVRLSAGKQVISSNVAMAMASVGRYRQRLLGFDGCGRASGELQGLVDSTARGIADVERLVAEAEHLLQSEVQGIVELALQFDLPDAVSQQAQHLLDRARR